MYFLLYSPRFLEVIYYYIAKQGRSIQFKFLYACDVDSYFQQIHQVLMNVSVVGINKFSGLGTDRINLISFRI